VLSGCGAKQQPAAPVQGNKEAAPAAPAPAAKPVTAGGKGTHYAVVPDKSSTSYTANEKFANRQLPNDAVGTTSVVQGELVLDGGALQPSKVTVDLRTLKSDESRRDSRLATQGLETQKYPFAEFTVKGAEGGVTIPADGKEVSFKLNGTMKIHDTEKPLVFDAKASLQGDSVFLTATVKFDMRDFNVQPPSIAGMLTVTELVKLDVKLTAKKM